MRQVVNSYRKTSMSSPYKDPDPVFQSMILPSDFYSTGPPVFNISFLICLKFLIFKSSCLLRFGPSRYRLESDWLFNSPVGSCFYYLTTRTKTYFQYLWLRQKTGKWKFGRVVWVWVLSPLYKHETHKRYIRKNWTRTRIKLEVRSNYTFKPWIL